MANVTDDEVADAIFAEDARINGHQNKRSDMDEGVQALFLAYAKVARQMLGERTVPLLKLDELKG